MSDESILVLGIGNILWADEGFGVRVIEALHELYEMPDHVTMLDGGTQGLFLLPRLENAGALIIVDAIDYGLPPGAMKVLSDDEIPAVLGARKVSLHQTGFQEILALLQFRGRAPRRQLLVGVQPERLDDYGGGLTPLIAAQIGPAVETVLDILAREFSVTPIPRREVEAFVPPAVTRRAYEVGRPSAEEACRIGDERVLLRRRG